MPEIKLSKKQQTRFDNLILTIELIPGPCWGRNVRANLKSQWKKLRAQIIALADNRCEICGHAQAKNSLHCHEIWEYDDNKKIQILKKFISICLLCHETKHIGQTRRWGRKYGDRAYTRFQEVNGLSGDDTKLFHDYFWQQWRQRSEHQWQLDLSHLNNYNIDLEKIKFIEIDRKYFAKVKKESIPKLAS